MLSGTAEYALRAIVYLAQHPEGPVRAGDLAAAASVPQNYLSKVLHELARQGVLTSSRGKHGGFRLAIDPERLTLQRVVAPFDEVTQRKRCVLGRPECSDRRPCPAHHRWKSVAEEINRFFRETTVADLLG